ncbi:hypothetical protein KJ068_28260 [bacterium]|nr:hypothetical protein [bacterium]
MLSEPQGRQAVNIAHASAYHSGFAFSKHVVMMRFENPCIVAHRVTAWLKKLQQNPFRPDNAKQACSKAVPIKKLYVKWLIVRFRTCWNLENKLCPLSRW